MATRIPGIRPDGKAFAVHARVRHDNGRGALRGLVAGDALGGGGACTDAAVALAESLMARGLYEHADVARPASSAERVVFAVPIGLFYANWPEMRLDASAAAAGPDDLDALAAVAANGALAAACWSGVAPRGMVVAALKDLDAATVRLAEASPERRAGLHLANVALRQDIASVDSKVLELPADSHPPGGCRLPFRAAMWALFHSLPPADAMTALLAHPGVGPAEAALLGALLGAAFGEGRIPPSWPVGAPARLLAFIRT